MNVRVMIDMPVEKLSELQVLLTNEVKLVSEEPAVVAVPEADKAEGTKPDEKSSVSDETATKSMLRAKGLELTQAGKKTELESVFKQFGAAKLRDLKEEDYAEAYRLLGEIR